MSEDTRAETPDEAEIPVAPPAHGPAGSPPTPPAWTYRAGGFHVDRDTSQAQKPAREPPMADAAHGVSRAGGASLGPVGRERAPLAVVLLSVVTLGLYALLWHRHIN